MRLRTTPRFAALADGNGKRHTGPTASAISDACYVFAKSKWICFRMHFPKPSDPPTWNAGIWISQAGGERRQPELVTMSMYQPRPVPYRTLRFGKHA